MAKTVAQTKTSVYSRGFEDDQAANIVLFTNDVIRELMNDHRWAFAMTSGTLTVVAGTKTYALPANVQHIESLRQTYTADPTLPELTPITADEMLELLATDPEPGNGTPRVWAQTAPTTVSIYPAPVGGTLTVRYQQTYTEVAADGDALPTPDMLFDLIVVGVAERLAKRGRQWEAADRFFAEWERRLSKAKAQLGLGQRQNAGRVGYSGDKQYAERF